MQATSKSIGTAILTLLFAGAATVQILSYFDVKAKDLMLTVGSWMTLLIAALFILAAVATAAYSLYLSLIRSRQLEARLATPQISSGIDDALQLRIHSAKWGTDLDSADVTSGLSAKQRNAIMFFVHPGAFEVPDPATGKDEKYVEVTYSFSGSDGPHTVRRFQREWLIIPEDPVAKKELQQTRKRIEQLESGRDDIRTAGELRLLASQSARLRETLLEIANTLKSESGSAGLAHLSQPLSLAMFPSQPLPWKWYHRSMWRFIGFYERLRAEVIGRSIVSDITEAGVVTRLLRFKPRIKSAQGNEKALLEQAAVIMARYA